MTASGKVKMMPNLDKKRIKIANELREQIALENELTPVQARAFIRGLQTDWRVPVIQWGQAESLEQYRDVRRLLNAASIFRSVEGSNSVNAKLCYNRAGELLEWLSRASDEVSSSIPLELLAAASYQLGSRPAMASALLAQAEQESLGGALYGRFLCADFDGVIRCITNFWRAHHELTARDAQSLVFLEDGDDKVGWFVTVELVRVLGLIADTVRRGEPERFELAKRKFAALEKMANRVFGDEMSLLVSLLHDIAQEYGEASIYLPLRQLSELNPKREDRLMRFARGQFSRGRGILWTSQRQGIKRLLEEESFALCTPTGSGKTLVANLAIVKELILRAEEGEGGLALYLVPSRALASEVEAKLSSELSNDVIVTGLYGGTDWGVTDYWLEAKEPTVLIATVEKADALMRYLGPLLLKRLRLLIVDEAHQVVPEDNKRTQDDFAEHSSRSLRLESFVSRLLSNAPNIVRIALTAVAGGAASPVARWIEGRNDAKPVGSSYRSTRQIIGSFETRPQSPGRMLLELLDGKSLFVRGRDEPVYINLGIPPMPPLPSKMRNSIYRFNQLDVLWSSLHLAKGGRRILISIAQQPERTMGWFKESLAQKSWKYASEFTLPEDEDNQRRFQNTRAACVDYCGENSFEVALLDHGIASSHGQMPHCIRRLMIGLIDRGICPVTIATATLTEGVNLPFDIIFVPSLKRRSFNSAAKVLVESPMSTAEFRNLAGRAGRPGAGNGLEGMTLVPIPYRPSSTAKGQIPTQRQQIAQMKDDWKKLRQSLLVEEVEEQGVESPLSLLLDGIASRARDLLNIDKNHFLDWLESVSPPDISEEAGCGSDTDKARLADSLDELDGVLLSSLEELQALDITGLNDSDAESALSDIWKRTFTVFAFAQEEWMEKAFVRRGQALLTDIYPDDKERSLLYQYGFTPYVGKRFEYIVPEIMALLKAATDYGEASNTDRLTLFVELGELLVEDRGFGFRVRATETDQMILDNWQEVLTWWMRGPSYEMPAPQHLRSWQRFVSENLEFRLGVSLGAVAAQAWSDGVEGELIVPSLDEWCETTGLPWFGFWARELIRWGTLDPFVAFALAEGVVKTRDDGELLRLEFDNWLKENLDGTSSEDSIDPQYFLMWNRSRGKDVVKRTRHKSIKVELVGTNGMRGRYSVIPVVSDDAIHWLDAAGFLIAKSSLVSFQEHYLTMEGDFELKNDRKRPVVKRTFSSTS
jgi:hypothetical protein